MGERPVLDALLVALTLLAAGCGSSAASPSGSSDGGAGTQYEAGPAGDDGSGSSPAGGDGGIAGACDDFTAAIFGCNLAVMIDTTRDMGRFRQFCENQANLPGSATTVAALEACARALKADCNASCQLPDVGTLAAGAPCNAGFDLQCQSAACTLSHQADGGYLACGTCAAPIALGQPCTPGTGNPTAVCTPGTYCSSANVCVKYGAPGATCAPNVLCAAGSFCSSAGVCTTDIATGGACTPGDECANALPCVAGKCAPPSAIGAACTDACVNGSMCDPATKKCVVPSVKPGAACGAGMLCVLGSCSKSGTCPAVVPDGQPCPKDGSAVCDVGASCDYTGVCEIPGSPVCR
jgi:hypothetical protein